MKNMSVSADASQLFSSSVPGISQFARDFKQHAFIMVENPGAKSRHIFKAVNDIRGGSAGRTSDELVPITTARIVDFREHAAF